MLLAVDIGNTQTSFGLFVGDTLKHHWRLDTRSCTTGDVCASFLSPLFMRVGLSFDHIEHIALCSVVPSANRVFFDFFQSYLSGRVTEIDYQSPLSFDLNVETPNEIGADRLANAEYACRSASLPALVVDFGTATTFDLILPGVSRPSYEGGVIIPGVRIALDALSGRASKLSQVDLVFPPSVIGKNTTTCIQSGLLYGYIDMINGLVARFDTSIGKRCELMLTGGLGHLFQDRLVRSALVLPDLTLEGIRLITSSLRIR